MFWAGVPVGAHCITSTTSKNLLIEKGSMFVVETSLEPELNSHAWFDGKERPVEWRKNPVLICWILTQCPTLSCVTVFASAVKTGALFCMLFRVNIVIFQLSLLSGVSRPSADPHSVTCPCVVVSRDPPALNGWECNIWVLILPVAMLIRASLNGVFFVTACLIVDIHCFLFPTIQQHGALYTILVETRNLVFLGVWSKKSHLGHFLKMIVFSSSTWHTTIKSRLL